MTDIKLSSAVSRYGGEADVEGWLRKFGIAADLKELTGEIRARSLGLLLDGPAFEVFCALSTVDRKDATKIAAALQEAFGCSLLNHARELRQCGEIDSVAGFEVVFGKFRKAIESMGGNDANVFEQRLLASLLIDSLPANIRAYVSTVHGKDLTLTEVMAVAKGMLQNQREDLLNNVSFASGRSTSTCSAAVDISASSTSIGAAAAASKVSANTGGVDGGGGRRCYGCGRIGHIRRNCGTRCYACGETGHARKTCPKNDNAGGTVVEVPPQAQ